ncbi:hypothetical protein B0T25DRAFT_574173 [Lasiosphaeria hispida]|uniref:Uncharacterized protein n=1 Tax=Lasiosphaeria hispida TaxID=260671 RepID=A0AAJ0M8N2_9PEZI|nr:hypothetical protein B0T25DRAFT_574173 [Lasiosphaeria hispida]
MTVLVHLGRQPTTRPDCSPIDGKSFGNSSFVTKQVAYPFAGNGNDADQNCLAWGTVSFTAGVIRAPESMFVLPQVVEYDPAVRNADGTISQSTEAEFAAAIMPSMWTEEALRLMTDTMVQIAVMNTSMLPTRTGLI